ADDRADRRPARPDAENRRGPGAHAVPLLTLAQPRPARERVGRTAARRRTAQPDDRARRADPRAAAARAHAVRRGGTDGARLSGAGPRAPAGGRRAADIYRGR